MSYYYKQEFVSPDPLYAEVKEELSSYFASGAIDDVMFPKWTEHCLRRFRKSAYKISEIVLTVKDYKACLPEDFKGVREAWACNTYVSDLYQSATAQYYQQDCRIDPQRTNCDECLSGADACVTDYNVVHKVTGTYYWSFKRTFLLTPGNLRAKSHCGDYCPNLGASTAYTFDVDNGNLVTNFCDGTVHLIYYAEATENGEQLVPDNFWVQEYIRKFIIYKCFAKLSNVITDESFNQIMLKKRESDQEQAVAYIVADTELKKQTVSDKMRAIKRNYERFNQYRLPGDPSYNARQRDI